MQTTTQPTTPAAPNAFASAPGLGAPAPMAQQLQGYGRGDDSMLVHMTPQEVNSLQGLAVASGGSLTTNPHTGLPEAGWLGKLLPTLVGFGLNAFLPGVGSAVGAALGGIGGAAGTGLLVGAGTGLITGDLKEGLTAGLGAFGGASLGSAVKGVGTAAASAAPGSAVQGATTSLMPSATNVGAQAAQAAGQATAGLGGAASAAVPHAATLGANLSLVPSSSTIASQAAGAAANATAGLGSTGGVLSKFGAAASEGLGNGMVAKAAPMVAGMGVLNSLSSGGVKDSQTGVVDNSYQGPYTAQKRNVIQSPSTQDLTSSSKERRWFDVAQPEIYNSQGQVAQIGSNTAPGTQIVTRTLNPKAKSGQNMYNYGLTPFTPGPGYAEGGQVGGLGGIVANAMPALAQQQQAMMAQYSPTQPAAPRGGLPQAAPRSSGEQPYMLADTRKAAGSPMSGNMSGVAVPGGKGGLQAAMRNASAKLTGKAVQKAAGGTLNMDEGAFVMPARETAEFGKGSTEAGHRALRALGGQPIRGKGDGVSDSIPAKIGGTTEARVADGETYFSRQAVERLGGGDHKKGTKKLYQMMKQAEKSRRSASRGGNGANLSKGLG